MIKIYYRANSSSSKRAISWCKKYGLKNQLEPINKITREDLVNILIHSKEGILEIIKRNGGRGTISNKIANDIMELAFNEALDYILLHTEILKCPIIFEDSKYLIGYNEDEIRMFLPKEYRRKYI